MQQSIHLTRDLPPISKPVESTERPVKKTKESMLKGVILKKNKDTRSEGRSSKPKNLDFKENEDNKHIDVARGSASLIEKNIVVSETSVLSTSSPPSFSELSTNNSDQKLIAYTSDSDEKAG